MAKPVISKLLKFKQWLTLPEAAKHLSNICEEEVTEADVLKLALDEYLKLSVYFANGCLAKRAYVLSSHGDKSDFVFFHKEVFDLLMTGDGKANIECKWQSLIGGSLVKSVNVGIYVENIFSGGIYKLQTWDADQPFNAQNLYPACELPSDSMLVVRTQILREFEQLISEDDDDKKISAEPHGNTERFAKNREEILGAALAVIAQWSEQCQNKLGEFEATKIAQLIDEKALLFWPKTGSPTLSRDGMERQISKWINKFSGD